MRGVRFAPSMFVEEIRGLMMRADLEWGFIWERYGRTRRCFIDFW